MKIFYLIGTAIVCFGLILLIKPKYLSAVLYMLAIGGVVNANFFHAGVTPIRVGKLPFGIDSIIYTLFVFCVLVMFFTQGKRAAYGLLISSLSAIVFAAVVQFLANAAVKGWGDSGNGQLLGSFMISVFASAAAMVAVLELAEPMRKKRIADALILIAGLVLATVVNSLLFYGLSAWMNGGLGAEFVPTFVASIIGKSIAIVFSIAAFFLMRFIDKKRESPKKRIGAGASGMGSDAPASVGDPRTRMHTAAADTETAADNSGMITDAEI